MTRTTTTIATTLGALLAAALLAGCGSKPATPAAPARSYAPASSVPATMPPSAKAGEPVDLPGVDGMPLVKVTFARPHCGTTRYAWSFSGTDGADIPPTAKPVAPAGQDFCELTMTVHNTAGIPARWLLAPESTLAVGPTTYDQSELADAITFELNSHAEHAGHPTCFFMDGKINPGESCTQYAVYQVPVGARPTALNVASDIDPTQPGLRVNF